MKKGTKPPGRGWLLLAACLNLVGVLLLVALWGRALWHGHVATEETTGEIVRVEVKWGAGNRITGHCPVIRWTIDGETVEHESPGCRDQPTDFEVDETVAIRYDPDDPSIVYLTSWWSVYNLAVLSTPAGLFLLILAWFLVHAYRYRSKVARGEIDPVAEARARAEKRRARSADRRPPG